MGKASVPGAGDPGIDSLVIIIIMIIIIIIVIIIVKRVSRAPFHVKHANLR